MSFGKVEVLAVSSSARVVQWGTIQTPTVLMQTAFGQPQHLLMHSQKAITEGSCSPTIAAIRYAQLWGHDESIAGSKRKLTDYLHLHNSISMVNLRDSADVKPEATESSVTVSTYLGRRVVSVEDFNTAIARMNPDVCVSLHDEVAFDVGKNRCKISVDRAIDWLPAVVNSYLRTYNAGLSVPDTASRRSDPTGESSAKSARTSVDDVKHLTRWFAYMPVVQEPAAMAKATEKIPKSVDELNAAFSSLESKVDGDILVGFALGGWKGNKAPSVYEAAVQCVVEKLPKDRLRMISCASDPFSVLAAIANGIDIVDSAIVDEATDKAMAWTFDYIMGSATKSTLSIDLTQASYAEEKGTLVEACGCIACAGIPVEHVEPLSSGIPAGAAPRPYVYRGHTRGYIYHLINTKEMLHKVLLQAHNTHHINKFISEVRRHILDGSFDEYQRWFRTAYAPTATL